MEIGWACGWQGAKKRRRDGRRSDNEKLEQRSAGDRVGVGITEGA
jgi:hypothetical protein